MLLSLTRIALSKFLNVLAIFSSPVNGGTKGPVLEGYGD